MAPLSRGGTEGARINASLWIEPGTSHPPNPDPISKALDAGMLSMACASMASILSNTGSPSPEGTLRITQVTVPPILSFLSLNSAMYSAIAFDAAGSGQRTGTYSSTPGRVMLLMRERKAGFVLGVGCVDVGGNICTFPTLDTKATISIPCASFKYFSAIALAATRPIVSLALLRPPPELALTPYFSRYVQSACEGRGYRSMVELP